ncbi:peptidase M75, Imelysin [Oleiphilus messinensis]|uniref:Peptidase M75, Imelysin n=2 Tax=Oleiphilus messinensis TaxID=141451 RepID=A0A1Y0I3G2_9GAMM|nr:peptidase M75, Imelysin [Oleiphilus messinensis]
MATQKNWGRVTTWANAATIASAVSATIFLAGCNSEPKNEGPATTEMNKPTAEAMASAAAAKPTVPAEQTIQTYINIAHASYSDSLSTAQALSKAIDALLANPSAATLAEAKAAWIAARVPYQQTEAYRFGNAVVDDWEGKVNAWPLDEGLIDYVSPAYGTDSDENNLYTANVIANTTLTVAGKSVDASKITPEFLAETLHEADEVDANVATGYHAIEFLLWGQDLNGTNQGAGARPATDFSLENCTGGHCERRREYLKAATDLLVSDLEEMVANWTADGAASKDLLAKGESGALATMLTGMGSLSYGELAGERIKLGLMLHDPEEEHDCFSDNTHWSHYYDAKGIKNVYTGQYKRTDGSVVKGTSLSDIVKTIDAALDAEMLANLANTESAMQAMVDQAAKGNTFDVLIGSGNTAGNQVIQNVVDALVAQTKTTEKVVSALGLDVVEIEGSDSLDNPSAVIQ